MRFELSGIFIIKTITEILARQPRNVASKVRYDYVCNAGKINFTATDGSLNTGHVMPDSCSPNVVWITIQFKRPALVFEAIIRLGTCDDCSDETITKFVGTLSSPQFPKGSISQVYPHKSKQGVSHRINFPITHGIFSRKFHLQNNKGVDLLSKQINLLEIELSEYNVSDRTFMGCFIYPVEGYTAFKYPSKNCKWLCTQKMYRAFGMIKTSCRCMDVIPKRVGIIDSPGESEGCGAMCLNDPANMCPNLNSYGTLALFHAHPATLRYMGCYKMFNIETKEAMDDLTLIKCIKFCTEKNFIYAAIHSTSCSCTEILEKNEMDETLCTTACVKEDYKMCGGPNHFSIYETFYGGPLHLAFDNNFRCNDSNFDENGVCPGNCSTYFHGEKCDEYIYNESYMFAWDDLPDVEEPAKSSLIFWIVVIVIGVIILIVLAGAGIGCLTGEEE